jgi:hydroxyisourate hydrolase
MISISTHVLDVSTGTPAAGIDVKLELVELGSWVVRSTGTTDPDGRIGMLASELDPGHYRLRFNTGEQGSGFFPEVAVTCNLDGTQEHYHIPLLLSPFGYTTYRGS